jgi:hypothetical protein
MKEEDLMPLSADLRSLLHAEQAAPAMPAALQDKISARLAETLLAPPGAPAGDGSPSSAGESEVANVADLGGAASGASASVSPLAALAAKPALLATLAFGLGASAGVGGTLYYASNSAATDTRPQVALVVPADAAPASLPTPDARPPAAADAAPVPQANPTDSTTTVAPPATRPPLGRDQTLASERAFLELARTAITRGDAATALQSLKKHARLHRRGQLSEERDALWVQALVLNKSFERAKKKGKTFRAKYPKSLFLPVVNHVLKDVP